MKLYLSRVQLNPLFAPSIKLAAQPEQIHKKLLQVFPIAAPTKEPSSNQPKTANILFRVDESEVGPVILIQSEQLPDWESLELAPRALLAEPQTKEFEPIFSPGQSLSFRLLTRPCVRKSIPQEPGSTGKRKPGPRMDCRDDDERLKWLQRKAESCGFQIESVGLTLFSLPIIKPTSDQTSKAKFSAVRFDGVLRVADPKLLAESVQSGIGQQKAFGFGLISLGRQEG